MRKWLFLLWMCFCVGSFLGCELGRDQPKLEGSWKGNIRVPNQSINLNLIFTFKQSFLGDLNCVLAIPQQLITNIDGSSCQLKQDSLEVKFAGEPLKATFRGKLINGAIHGEWSQGGYTFPLHLTRGLNQSGVTQFLETGLHFAQQYALQRDTVNWAELRRRALVLSQNASTVEELVPAFQLILRHLQDKHGAILQDNTWIGYQPDVAVSTELKRAASGINKEVVSSQFAPHTGYVRIPTTLDATLSAEKPDPIMEDLQKQVCSLMEQGVQNWILDFRLHSGGNLFITLAGLSDLFGEGRVGSFVDQHGKITSNWILKGGNAYQDDRQKTFGGSRCRSINPPKKIAILVGPVTSSAAEGGVIALSGLPNTKVFGEPTKGFVTATQGIQLKEGLTFFVSTAYQSDAQGRIYKDAIKPDVPVMSGDNFKQLDKDLKVKAALAWFAEP